MKSEDSASSSQRPPLQEAAGFGFAVLSSGSKANCTFVSDFETSFLIDCGLSGKKTADRLAQLGFAIEEIDHLIITHEHSDHISGLSPVSKRSQALVHGSELTAQACGILDSPFYSALPEGNVLQLGKFSIEFFSTHHDAVDPVGMVIEHEGVRLGYLTDTGHVSSDLESRLVDLDGLILEANHDLGMLENSPYPDYVRDRIAGPKGHLGNIAAG